MKNMFMSALNKIERAEEMKPYFHFKISSWDEWRGAKNGNSVVIYDGYNAKEAAIVLWETKDDETFPCVEVRLLKDWDEIQEARKTQGRVFKPSNELNEDYMFFGLDDDDDTPCWNCPHLEDEEEYECNKCPWYNQ